MKFWGVRIGSIVAALAGCFLLDAVSKGFDAFTLRLLVLACLYVTLAVSLNLINGITGQFSMGHAAFYQVGAYTGGIISVNNPNPSVPPWLWLIAMILAGGIVAGIAGKLVGLPALRLKGDYLAIVTLAFGEIIRIVVQNQPQMGGSYGMNITPKFPAIFGPTGTTGVWMVMLLAIVCIAVCRNLLRTAHGLPFLAVREDEVAAAAMGVNVPEMKSVAFVIGSAFAGAAGAILAHFEGFISPTMFTMDLSFVILTMVVLGGTGSITGSALAAVVLFYLPEKLRDMPPVPLSFLIGAVIALIAMVGAMKWISNNYHGESGGAAVRYVGAVIGAIVLTVVLGLIFKAIPQVAVAPAIEAAKLRMVIFAVTLIVLMLLRPQGVLGHYELTWSLFKKPKPMETFS